MSDPDPDMEKLGSENSPYEARVFPLSIVVVIPGANPQIQGKRQSPFFPNRFKAMVFESASDGVGIVIVGVANEVPVGIIPQPFVEVNSTKG